MPHAITSAYWHGSPFEQRFHARQKREEEPLMVLGMKIKRARKAAAANDLINRRCARQV